MKNDKKFTAFTLLELLVVMAIISVVMLLGIWGMISFQRIVQLQQAASEVNAVIKETRSKAENNVFPEQYLREGKVDFNKVYGYEISFNNSDTFNAKDLSRSLCRYQSSLQGSGLWDCVGTTISFPDNDQNIVGLKSNIFSDIQYVVDPNFSQPLCTSILFENLTGDIWIYINGSNNWTPDGKCAVFIKHKLSKSGILLTVDATGNSFKLQNQ
ncbi:MAG: prepilin-type N-terminal cleavage/methylation domain-containing protein [bacterium]